MKILEHNFSGRENSLRKLMFIGIMVTLFVPPFNGLFFPLATLLTVIFGPAAIEPFGNNFVLYVIQLAIVFALTLFIFFHFFPGVLKITDKVTRKQILSRLLMSFACSAFLILLVILGSAISTRFEQFTNVSVFSIISGFLLLMASTFLGLLWVIFPVSIVVTWAILRSK